MYKESDIMHERGNAWVLRDTKRQCYTVYCVGLTHSTSDSAYPLTPDGLSIAVCRCDYLASRNRRMAV